MFTPCDLPWVYEISFKIDFFLFLILQNLVIINQKDPKLKQQEEQYSSHGFNTDIYVLLSSEHGTGTADYSMTMKDDITQDPQVYIELHNEDSYTKGFVQY